MATIKEGDGFNTSIQPDRVLDKETPIDFLSITKLISQKRQILKMFLSHLDNGISSCSEIRSAFLYISSSQESFGVTMSNFLSFNDFV